MQAKANKPKPIHTFSLKRVAFALLIVFAILYSANREAESSNAKYMESLKGTFDLSPEQLGWSHEWSLRHKVTNIKPYPSFDSEID